ncbi:glycosyltransferase family 1 protein [candidate division WS5 bacterium]|uniref:Glycosyltransferase family 1 protein n=1 Tax=candidate division WS5 bacterium TaxID=2093353 RepID=A0A419DGG1_9BACT|nr:MAG: glycosyltransferase family 1 protein [candidate division WS5 bacterium]
MIKNEQKRMENILLVTTSNFPFGGPSANVLRLLTIGLAKTHRNVEVLLQRGICFGKVAEDNKRKGSIEGVSYAHCGYLISSGNYLKKILDIASGIIVPLIVVIRKKIESRVDCVLLYNSTAYECLALFAACKILRIPIINHVVEWYEKETVVASWWKLPKWWDFLFRMKILNLHFDGLMVTSHFLKNYYTEKNFSGRKILILPNLVDISNFNSDEVKNLKNNNILRIGYCGTPTRKDGIDDLLKAFQSVQMKHPNSELLVIGDTTVGGSLIPKLVEKAERLGILKKVKFTGLVKWEQIPGLLNSCDMLALARPSGRFAEAGFPTKLGEYMACGKPVVLTKVGDMPFYLEDKENAMLAEPDNPESVASKICYLIENPDQAKKIGENGLSWVEQNLEFVKTTWKVGNFMDIFRK